MAVREGENAQFFFTCSFFSNTHFYFLSLSSLKSPEISTWWFLLLSQDPLSTWHTKGSHQALLEQIHTGTCGQSGREGRSITGVVGRGWGWVGWWGLGQCRAGLPWVWLESTQGEESLLTVGLGRNEGTWSLEKLSVSDLAAMTGKLQRVI